MRGRNNDKKSPNGVPRIDRKKFGGASLKTAVFFLKTRFLKVLVGHGDLCMPILSHMAIVR